MFLSSNTSAGWVSLCPFLEDDVETHDLEGTVWGVEDLEVLDVGFGNMALKESARASVAQADRFG